MLDEMSTRDTATTGQDSARHAGGRGSQPKARQPSVRQRAGALRKFLWRNRSFTVGLVLVTIALVCAVFSPWVAPHNPYQQDVKIRLAPPFWTGGAKYQPGYVLGTDQLGRDLLSRMIFGIRTSLIIGVTSVFLAISIGLTVGLFSGFFSPGLPDSILMRITDVQLALPFIVLAIAILSLVKPTPLIIICVLSLAAWPMYARVVRSIIITEKEADYVTAARVQGASNLRIIVNYFARNVVAPVFIVGTIDIATMIVFEALLSFIQLGIQPPEISLGNIMADGKNYIATAPWITGLPGLAIMFTVLGFNLMGDTLQNYIDPKLRR